MWATSEVSVISTTRSRPISRVAFESLVCMMRLFLDYYFC